MAQEVRGPSLGVIPASQPDQVSLAGQHTGVGSLISPSEKEAFELGGGSQLRLDRAEVGRELGAHALDRRNNRNRDTGGNQAVFDGGSARLVSEKLLENDFQLCLLFTLGSVQREQSVIATT